MDNITSSVKIRKILILGVGNAQCDAIRYCKNQGYDVHAVSYRNEGRGIELVDHFKQINIIDKEAVLEYARSIGVDIVYSVGSDMAMPTVGYVSEKMGLPFFVKEETALLLQNKDRLRKFIKDNDLGYIPYLVADFPDELSAWKSFPAILKPVDSQGQRGIFEVNNSAELLHFFNKSLSFSHAKKVIVEHYIDGPEISANAFVINGELIYNFITDRFVVDDVPGGVVRGHRLPSSINEKTRQYAEERVFKAIKALGIQNGPVYFQMKYNEKGVFIIEITPRLDGCHIWRLIKQKYGVDLLALSFQLLDPEEKANLMIEQDDRSVHTGALDIEFMLQPSNTVFQQEVPVQDALYEEYYYAEGDMVRPVNWHAEKTGYRIINAKK